MFRSYGGNLHECSHGEAFLKLVQNRFTENGLYILDEPNAAMDLITEYEIFELYKSILENKMGIIIIHKLNYITKIVDKIIVLDEGELVESGTHENLIKNNKLYYRLYNLNKI